MKKKKKLSNVINNVKENDLTVNHDDLSVFFFTILRYESVSAHLPIPDSFQ